MRQAFAFMSEAGRVVERESPWDWLYFLFEEKEMTLKAYLTITLLCILCWITALIHRVIKLINKS
jgi:hypothetical protein